MRGVAGAALLLSALAACNREPSFDERYAKAQQAIRDKAGAIDAEIATRESEAAVIESLGGASGTAEGD